MHSESDIAWQSDRLLQSSKSDQHPTQTHNTKGQDTINFCYKARDSFIHSLMSTQPPHSPVCRGGLEEGRKTNARTVHLFIQKRLVLGGEKGKNKCYACKKHIRQAGAHSSLLLKATCAKSLPTNPHQPCYRTTAVCSNAVWHRRWMAAIDCKHSRLRGRHSASIGATG